MVSNRRLSKNFTLHELCKSEIASRNRFDNSPDYSEIDNLTELSVKVLQPIRDKWGSTSIRSGFRCFEVEKNLYRKKVSNIYRNYGIAGVFKWFRRKSHPRGQAADIEIVGLDNKKLFEWVKRNLEYDQVILEYYEEGEPNSGWVHVSYRRGHNRNQSSEIN